MEKNDKEEEVEEETKRRVEGIRGDEWLKEKEHEKE
jgi:hypothetical protein